MKTYRVYRYETLAHLSHRLSLYFILCVAMEITLRLSSMLKTDEILTAANGFFTAIAVGSAVVQLIAGLIGFYYVARIRLILKENPLS